MEAMVETIGESYQWREPINITKEQWMSILEDREVTTEHDKQILQLLYESANYTECASQLAHLLGMPYHGPINLQVGRWGKRIVERLAIQAPRKKQGQGYDWWRVPFWGKGAKGKYYWTLRPELQEAMRELYALKEDFLPQQKDFPEEVDTQQYEHLYEGAIKQIFVNSYECSRKARAACIRHYGISCVICGFDFERTYGQIARDVIHVHHLKPLSAVSKEYQVDPINDLRPVYPNCHVVIHKKNLPFSVEEVIVMMEDARKNG